eukprot:4723426-Prymnesium_polylepis.1
MHEDKVNTKLQPVPPTCPVRCAPLSTSTHVHTVHDSAWHCCVVCASPQILVIAASLRSHSSGSDAAFSSHELRRPTPRPPRPSRPP